MEVDEAEGRKPKKQKLINGASNPRGPKTASRLFAPYRTVGLVSPTSVPFTSVPLGKTTFQITTSTGRSLQTYDLRRGLNLVFITRPQTPEIITASASWKDRVLASWGGESLHSKRSVWVFRRGKKEAELELPADWTENVKVFCIFGSWIVGVCETQILVWKSSNYELHTSLQGTSPMPFTSCIASLPTFLNKIVIGRQDGSVEVWNVLTGKLLHTIVPASTAYGAVTAIQPTPALSIVAIAFENGPLLLHDVRTDQPLMQLKSPAGAAVTSISFRTDGLGAGEDGTKAGVMATASTATGDITLWDLNHGGRRTGVLRSAHAAPTNNTPGGTGKIEFLSGQSVLVSSGLDNSLKSWIFDETPFSPIPRILHERRGHGAPVSKLMFLPSASDGSDDTGKWLLSGSKDRSLWGWSLRRDGQSTELSQGSVQKKAKKQGLLSGDRGAFESLKCPPITCIACNLNRDGGMGAIPGKQSIWQHNAKDKHVSAEVSAMTGWESVLTAHENDKKARTWFWGRKRAGRWAFETGDGSNVTAVAMSPCGTFGLVGSENGGIDMFNMQSGIHRQRFPARLTPMQAKQLRLDVEKHGLIEESNGKRKFYRGQGKHGTAIVGLAVDGLNKTVLSASTDGEIEFWSFENGLLQHRIDWTASTRIIKMQLHRESGLAAFVCTDFCVRVVDISTQKLVRELWPARTILPELSNLVLHDITFSQDGRWIAAYADSLVFLWDLPTGHLIDAFKLKATCTTLAFSPTGEFLAMATKDNVGVDIWSNRSLFMHVPTRHISQEELLHIVRSREWQAPTNSGEARQGLIAESAYDDEDQKDPGEGLWDTMESTEADVNKLASDLISLSLVPRSRWQNLLHLDLIRERNKPIEPAKKPEKAPFFLPSLQDRQTQNQLPASETVDASELEKERSRVLKLSKEGARNEFTSLLIAARDTTDYTLLLDHLKELSPAAADIEIRSLSHEDNEFNTFVQALTSRLRQKGDFELVQAWMAVFLRVHGDVIVADQDVRAAVQQWQEALEQEKQRVQKLSSYCSGLAAYLRAARV